MSLGGAEEGNVTGIAMIVVARGCTVLPGCDELTALGVTAAAVHLEVSSIYFFNSVVRLYYARMPLDSDSAYLDTLSVLFYVVILVIIANDTGPPAARFPAHG